MIDNFLTSMDGTKFEDKLSLYKDNELMGNAFTQKMNSKISFSESQLKKVSDSIKLKRRLFSEISYTIDNILDGRFGMFPVPNYDYKFRKRIRMEFEIAYQASLEGRDTSIRTSFPVYNNTRIYLENNFGWVYANAQSMTEPEIKKMYDVIMTEIQ